MILLLRCSGQNVTCLQNSLQLLTKQPLVSVNLLPCQWISTTNCNLEEERHSAAERRKHMRENASCGKARLECILLLQCIFRAHVTSELRKRIPMVHMQR